MKRISIKGKLFKAGKPVVCVPVVDRTREEIMESIRNLSSMGIPMIEWRMDFYEKGKDEKAVCDLLSEMKEYTRQNVLMCTFRSSRQGGEQEISEAEYKNLLLAAAGSGAADIVDLEFFERTDQEKLIDLLHGKGVLAAASEHDFEKTPGVGQMSSQLLSMHEAGADFCKLAVMPQKKTDVLRLMEAVLTAKEQAGDMHVIAMSMGDQGMISRIAGEWFGSEVTFASFSQASAPGQIEYDREEAVLDHIHSIMGENDR